MWLFIGILGWPLLEIALFVVVGGQIGLWLTLAWVLLSAVLGVLILRLTMARQALGLRDMRDPARLAAGGAMGMLGGLLLILPGFFTDALGLLLLLPPVQMLIARRIAGRFHIVQTSRSAKDDIVDAEFSDITPRRNSPSGWTQID